MTSLVTWMLHVFSPWASLVINLIAVSFFTSRIVLKYTKPATRPGFYAKFRQFLSHLALQLGELNSII